MKKRRLAWTGVAVLVVTSAAISWPFVWRLGFVWEGEAEGVNGTCEDGVTFHFERVHRLSGSRASGSVHWCYPNCEELTSDFGAARADYQTVEVTEDTDGAKVWTCFSSEGDVLFQSVENRGQRVHTYKKEPWGRPPPFAPAELRDLVYWAKQSVDSAAKRGEVAVPDILWEFGD